MSSFSSIPGKRNQSRWKLRSHHVLMTYRKSELGMHSRSFWMYMVILVHEPLLLRPLADRFHWPGRSYHPFLPHRRRETLLDVCLELLAFLLFIINSTY